MTTVAAALLAVLAVGVLTAASIAVRSVSRIWLRHWVERRLAGATLAELYLERPQRLIASAGLGITIAVFLAGAAASGAATSPGDAAARVGVTLVAIVLLGQLLPRAAARRWPAQLVPALIPVLRAVDAAVAPLRAVGHALARPLTGARPADAVTPAEAARDNIEELLLEGAREGVGETQDIAIIAGVVQFGEKTARDVMTPRADVFALDVATEPGHLARLIAASGYSRVPLYRGTLDDVVGMTHVTDVYKTAGEVAPPVRPVATTQAGTRCNDLLFEMLRAQRHLAVVRDDAGATVGIVTLEDVLEELVGEIRDEHDDAPPPAPDA